MLQNWKNICVVLIFFYALIRKIDKGKAKPLLYEILKAFNNETSAICSKTAISSTVQFLFVLYYQYFISHIFPNFAVHIYVVKPFKKIIFSFLCLICQLTWQLKKISPRIIIYLLGSAFVEKIRKTNWWNDLMNSL